MDTPVDESENQLVQEPEPEVATLGAEDILDVAPSVEGEPESPPDEGDEPAPSLPSPGQEEEEPADDEQPGPREDQEPGPGEEDEGVDSSWGNGELNDFGLDETLPEIFEEERWRGSPVFKIEIDPSSPAERKISFSQLEETLSSVDGGDNGDQKVDENLLEFEVDPSSKPKYQIKEFVESASKLKFEIRNSNTTFCIYLPTLKKVVEIPEWEKVKLKREQPGVAQAMQIARERTRQFRLEVGKRDYRMTESEVNHILYQEKARVIKARLLQQGRGIKKDLTEPPQRWDPSSQCGQRKRPTEYPPMSTLDVNLRSKDNLAGARQRCARVRYNHRSDSSFMLSEQQKLLRAAERLQNFRMANEKEATPPQRHDPWAVVTKPRKIRPNIHLPQHRHSIKRQ